MAKIRRTCAQVAMDRLLEVSLPEPVNSGGVGVLHGGKQQAVDNNDGGGRTSPVGWSFLSFCSTIAYCRWTNPSSLSPYRSRRVVTSSSPVDVIGLVFLLVMVEWFFSPSSLSSGASFPGASFLLLRCRQRVISPSLPPSSLSRTAGRPGGEEKQQANDNNDGGGRTTVPQPGNPSGPLFRLTANSNCLNCIPPLWVYLRLFNFSSLLLTPKVPLLREVVVMLPSFILLIGLNFLSLMIFVDISSTCMTECVTSTYR